MSEIHEEDNTVLENSQIQNPPQPQNPSGGQSIEDSSSGEDSEVRQLIAAISNDPEAAKGHARSGGLGLDKLKKVAKYLRIPVTQAKDSLVDAIVQKIKRKKEMEALRHEEEISLGTSFRKNKNTTPRIINFLMQYPDALQRSFCLAQR
jgi:hypothetical protein